MVCVEHEYRQLRFGVGWELDNKVAFFCTKCLRLELRTLEFPA